MTRKKFKNGYISVIISLADTANDFWNTKGTWLFHLTGVWACWPLIAAWACLPFPCRHDFLLVFPPFLIAWCLSSCIYRLAWSEQWPLRLVCVLTSSWQRWTIADRAHATLKMKKYGFTFWAIFATWDLGYLLAGEAFQVTNLSYFLSDLSCRIIIDLVILFLSLCWLLKQWHSQT